MPNKLSVGLAVSLLLSGSFSGMAIADDATSALEKQIMNGDASPTTGNPDNIPWMNKDGSVKPSASPVEIPIIKPITSTPIVSPPAAVATPLQTPSENIHAVTPKPEVREHAEINRSEKGHAIESRTLEKEKPIEAKPIEAQSVETKKTKMLFGRIEQLTAASGAKFPELKAMTPQMDTRLLTARAQTTALQAGAVVKSFPTNYEGNWGGRLVLQQVQVDPNYYSIDPEEARRTAQAMKLGNVGQVNFMFDKTGGKIALAPARCLFMVPATDTQVPDEMKKMLGNSGGNAAFGGMMSQMVASMPVPIVLEFGEVQTGAGETSVSGNQLRQRVIKNEVRQLAPNVLEQQIVTSETTWDKRTGRPRTGYGESVMRFTRQNATTVYVQCATVSYGADKKFLAKMVLYGSAGKGVVMNTDPMQAMGGMSGMSGLGGLGGLGGLFGGQTPGGASQQMPGMPAGGLDMLKNLFGGQ